MAELEMESKGLNFTSSPKIPTANSSGNGEWPKESTGQTGWASQIEGGRGHLQSDPMPPLNERLMPWFYIRLALSLDALNNRIKSLAGNSHSCTNCQRCTNPKCLNAWLCLLFAPQPTSIPSTKPESFHPWWVLLFHMCRIYSFYPHAGLTGRSLHLVPLVKNVWVDQAVSVAWRKLQEDD